MQTPPNQNSEHSQTQASQISLDSQIAELIKHKKRWDKIDKELRELRDELKVAGRLKQADKAMMILHLECGHNLFQVIQHNYPQYLYKHDDFHGKSIQKKGCLGILMLAIIPLALITGYVMYNT